jgi:hypothetical protein
MTAPVAKQKGPGLTSLVGKAPGPFRRHGHPSALLRISSQRGLQNRRCPPGTRPENTTSAGEPGPALQRHRPGLHPEFRPPGLPCKLNRGACSWPLTMPAGPGEGRDVIGIDLDERNAELARDRVGGLFRDVEYPDTVGAA